MAIPLTPQEFLDIFERFARTPPEVCVKLGGVGKFSSKGLAKGRFPGPGDVGRTDKFPEWLSSCGGQGTAAVILAAILASAVRAFFTLEGLCGPESTIRRWLFCDFLKSAESDRRTVAILV
jgi:hypothetical protein